MTSVNSVLRRPLRQFDVRARSIFGRRLLMRVHVTMETNEVGLFIWSLCDGRKSVEDIVDALISNYDVDRATALGHVTDLLDAFSEAQFIDWVES